MLVVALHTKRASIKQQFTLSVLATTCHLRKQRVCFQLIGLVSGCAWATQDPLDSRDVSLALNIALHGGWKDHEWWNVNGDENEGRNSIGRQTEELDVMGECTGWVSFLPPQRTTSVVSDVFEFQERIWRGHHKLQACNHPCIMFHVPLISHGPEWEL